MKYEVIIVMDVNVPQEEEDEKGVWGVRTELEDYYTTIMKTKGYFELLDLHVLAGKVEEKGGEK